VARQICQILEAGPHNILSRITLVMRQITREFWICSLNLLDFNSYNYSYSLHRFTAHKPETCLLVRYHFTSYLIVHSLVLSLLLTVWHLCLHLLKTIFRQPSREHLVEGFGLSVVMKTTPPLCREHLSVYSLSRERVYNCHPDNSAYSALFIGVV
jgi:hypothetical protein